MELSSLFFKMAVKKLDILVEEYVSKMPKAI